MTNARARADRLVSLDVMRGLGMVLMAIDHVRVYSGLPAGGPTPGIFFTRWVTNFCAPAFVFFAGTSAFLSGRMRPASDLARHLVTRGAWLVLIELTVIRVAWTFNVDYAHYVLAGVIWMLGVCMILLAGPLSGVRRRHRDPVRAVPMVRRGQGSASGAMSSRQCVHEQRVGRDQRHVLLAILALIRERVGVAATFELRRPQLLAARGLERAEAVVVG